MPRSDARENRARIVDVARSAFAETGEISMNRIAQQAGVGAGTLYRHFPTRDALILAIYAHELTSIVDAVPDLLRTQPPLEALRTWTAALVEAMRLKHGLGSALTPDTHHIMSTRSREPIIAAIAELLDAGKRDGSIRGDIEPDDYLQLTGALWRSAAGPTDRSPQLLAVILDGLRRPEPKASVGVHAT